MQSQVLILRFAYQTAIIFGFHFVNRHLRLPAAVNLGKYAVRRWKSTPLWKLIDSVLFHVIYYLFRIMILPLLKTLLTGSLATLVSFESRSQDKMTCFRIFVSC